MTTWIAAAAVVAVVGGLVALAAGALRAGARRTKNLKRFARAGGLTYRGTVAGDDRPPWCAHFCLKRMRGGLSEVIAGEWNGVPVTLATFAVLMPGRDTASRASVAATEIDVPGVPEAQLVRGDTGVMTREAVAVAAHATGLELVDMDGAHKDRLVMARAGGAGAVGSFLSGQPDPLANHPHHALAWMDGWLLVFPRDSGAGVIEFGAVVDREHDIRSLLDATVALRETVQAWKAG
ncbi:MAG: hypothetical protein OER88_01660 [Planctomycetota bacterium]|nr:hypothetical protein [Planctomycetota bacterium]